MIRGELGIQNPGNGPMVPPKSSVEYRTPSRFASSPPATAANDAPGCEASPTGACEPVLATVKVAPLVTDVTAVPESLA